MKIINIFALSCFLIAILGPGLTASRAANQDPVQLGNELLELSGKQNRSDHPLALTTAHTALVLFQRVNDNPGIARAYFQIGRCHHAMSDLIGATDNYQKALEQWRNLNDLKEQASTLIMLAFVEHRKGEWNNAISYYHQAQALGQNSSYQLGQIANGLGYLFNDTGMPESALIQFERSLGYYQEANDPLAVNRATMDIAYTEMLLGRYAHSLMKLQQVLPTFEPSSVDRAECHENLGQVYLGLHDYPQALNHLQAALDLYDQAKNPLEAERVRSLIGQAYEQQGALARARGQYLQALSVFRRIQDRLNEAAVYFLLGRVELKAGQLDVAETYLKQSIDYTEELRSVSVGREVTAAYSASVHDRYEAYITCLLRKSKSAASPALSERAFEASELSRARSLVEVLRDSQTNLLAGVDPRLTEREKTLRQAIKAKTDYRIELLKSGTHRRKELTDLEAILQQLRQEHRQLYQQLSALNPAYTQLTQPTAFSLQQIQKEVIEDAQTALLEYVLADDTSYVWVVTRNNIKVTELASKAAITEAVQKLYDLLSVRPKERSDTAITKATEQLAAMVINPIADQLTASRIIVVADGALNYIPFQLLTLPSDPEPLIATREIVNAPSASIVGQLRTEKQRRGTPDNVVAAFGYPAFASNYAELKDKTARELMEEVKKDGVEPWASTMRDIEISGEDVDTATIRPLIHSREELANLREVAGPASFFATGFAASRETLLRTDLSKFAILHFATHGALNPKRPEKSGFLLSTVGPDGRLQNGFVTVPDVYQLQAPVYLVVLSACRTGLGKDIRGEGVNSLTRGFMYAGASSIAASLWNVNDEATAELMKHFYANMLQQGMTPAAALRAAQNSIRQQPQWSSPHFWAGFTLHGEYRELPKLPATDRRVFTAKNIIVAAMSVVLLAGIGWWYWRQGRRVTI